MNLLICWDVEEQGFRNGDVVTPYGSHTYNGVALFQSLVCLYQRSIAYGFAWFKLFNMYGGRDSQVFVARFFGNDGLNVV